MTYSLILREEELKNKVAHDYFSQYDTTKIIGNIDFCISRNSEEVTQLDLLNDLSKTQSFLWAEAKKGNKNSIYESLVQLILTIGKARTFEQYLPPIFLGAFDAEKIAFIEYDKVSWIFYKNDFNWNVTPSNHETKSFQVILSLVKSLLEGESLIFKFSDEDEESLKKFIQENFKIGRGVQRIAITKNNFTTVYLRWLREVKLSIDVDWDLLKKNNILDADFFLADLLSENNESIKDALFVLLKYDHYIFGRHKNVLGLETIVKAKFQDGQKAHRQFWNIYVRPPKKEFWDYIVERRDLLVPQDIRERKGSFFTPQQWVELSQQYLADALGEDWQDEYIIWDCCAGTGNLLNGLMNKYNIFASTIDKADLDVMKDRIKNGANLLETHVFQFDFLNDDLFGDKMPENLKEILKSPEKRKKLLIYINPPYAEAASKKTVAGSGANKTNVAVTNKVYTDFFDAIGIAGRELFAQFAIRIYKEIPECTIGMFSTLKILNAPNFSVFRETFKAKLLGVFLVPSYTFDNVKGHFPIAFQIYDTSDKCRLESCKASVYDDKGAFLYQKNVGYSGKHNTINDWIIKTRKRQHEKEIGFLSVYGADFQHQNYLFIINNKAQLPHPRGTVITDKNILEICIYYAVRKCIKANWVNDRDQFYEPNDKWMADRQFQSDCVAFTLFDNNISHSEGTNHWIPFSEQEVDARERFQSHFMLDFIHGSKKSLSLFDDENNGQFDFSPEAQAVFNAGRILYRYYHSKPDSNPNASFYDIRLYFQGKDAKGRMNSKSSDDYYTELLGLLREAHRKLAKKIEPKVYEYGFLL